MLKVGLTGNIGSGKTLMANIFEALGAPVFNADEQARWLMNQEPIKDQLRSKFGQEIFDLHGMLNRKALADIIFTNPAEMDYVNALVHPAVMERFHEWCSQVATPTLVIFEAAILIESGLFEQFDKIILVSAPSNIRMQRIVSRDQVKPEKVLSRMQNQWPEEDKLEYADYIVCNDGCTPLIAQCLNIHSGLLEWVCGSKAREKV